MKRILILIAASLISYVSHAQLVSWTFDETVKGNEAVSLPTQMEKGLMYTELTRGAGVRAQKATLSFASAWPGCADREDAYDQSAYYEFKLGAKKKHTLSLDYLSVVLRVQPDGPKVWVLRYSLDGKEFKDAALPVTIESTGNNGKRQKPIDLSVIPELQNIPAKKVVTFRIYAWGSLDDSTNTAFRIGKSVGGRTALAVFGTVNKK